MKKRAEAARDTFRWAAGLDPAAPLLSWDIRPDPEEFKRYVTRRAARRISPAPIRR